jgi:hypothetical protein
VPQLTRPLWEAAPKSYFVHHIPAPSDVYALSAKAADDPTSAAAKSDSSCYSFAPLLDKNRDVYDAFIFSSELDLVRENNTRFSPRLLLVLLLLLLLLCYPSLHI